MTSEIDLFRAFCQSKADCKLGQPTTEDAIAAFEARYGIRLPADIREYFLKINGVFDMGGWVVIKPLDEWQSFEEIRHTYPTGF